MLLVKLILELIIWPFRGSFPKFLPVASLSLSLSGQLSSYPMSFSRAMVSSCELVQPSSSPDLSQLPSWKTNICSLTHWATPFNKTVKKKKGKGKFSLNIFVPLNTLITCSRVSRDIPLYPLARTLILSANSMRDLSGVKGFPTPETVTEPSWLLTRYQQGQKRETPSNLSLPAECERTKFTWSSLQKKKYIKPQKKSHQVLFCTKQKEFLKQLSHLTPNYTTTGLNCSLFFLSWKERAEKAAHTTYLRLLFGMTVLANFPKPVVIP